MRNYLWATQFYVASSGMLLAWFRFYCTVFLTIPMAPTWLQHRGSMGAKLLLSMRNDLWAQISFFYVQKPIVTDASSVYGGFVNLVVNDYRSVYDTTC